MNPKKNAAERAVDLVENNMIVGLGTGSTAYWAIQKIGERVRDGLQIRAIASSTSSETLAKEVGIPILDSDHFQPMDIYIDGADEVDEHCNLIKGGGGALLREKILASNSKKFIVVVDESKMVKRLGKFHLPIEIVPFASSLTMIQLQVLGGAPVLRKKEGQLFISDNGNLIADCNFFPINDPAELNLRIKNIPGVVETGLFLNDMVDSVFVGLPNGEVTSI
jgi:ribose 5-phosphate isomerase A